MTAADDLPHLLDLLDPDAEAVEAGRRRMEAVWRGERPDRLPIVFCARVPELDGFRRPTQVEIQSDPAAMLVDQLFSAIGCARSRSDAQVTVRANVGVPFVATLFGLNADVVEGSLPWLKERLTKDRIAGFELPEGLASLPPMKRVLDLIAFFREKLDGRGRVFLADTQGPFDVAHLVRGEDLFLDIYDDPPFVEHLLSLATKMYVAATKLMREAVGEAGLVGEPDDGGHTASYHMGGVYVGRGAARVCEDTTTLLSPAHIERFAAPYTARALEEAGEGWVHYCGSNPAFERIFVDEMDACRGLNLGNPEMHDLPPLMAHLAERGKVYWGSVPRLGGEPLHAYFRRVIDPVREHGRGLVFDPQLRREEAAEPARVIAAWEAAHDG